MLRQWISTDFYIHYFLFPVCNILYTEYLLWLWIHAERSAPIQLSCTVRSAHVHMIITCNYTGLPHRNMYLIDVGTYSTLNTDFWEIIKNGISFVFDKESFNYTTSNIIYNWYLYMCVCKQKWYIYMCVCMCTCHYVMP